MAIVVPDMACLREPNLLIPGKKPIGNVKIDWDHPLTAGGMKFIYMPNVLDKFMFALTGVTESHAGLDFTASTDRATSSIKAIHESKPSAWVAVFTPRSYGSGSTFGRIIGNLTSDYAPSIYLRSATTGITWRIKVSDGTDSYNWDTGGFTWGHKYCFVLATKGTSGSTRAWLYDLTDHILQASVDGVSGIITSSTNTGVVLGNRKALDRGFDGIIEMIAQFGGMYGWDNGDKIAADPYQFLIPA